MNKYFKNFLNLLFELEREPKNGVLEISKLDFMHIIELPHDKVAFLNKDIEPKDLIKLFENESYINELLDTMQDWKFGYEFALEYQNLSIDDDLLQYFDDEAFFNEFKDMYQDRILSYEYDTLDTLIELDLNTENE